MNENTSLRKLFGEQLEKQGAKAKNILVLDSNLSNNLYTLHFAKSFPERHFTIGQGESSMLAMAAGMAVRKKIPIVCAEAAPLLGKAFDMLRNGIASPNLNIKIILSGTGLSNIEESTPRTCTEDLAILQTLPNLKIFTPADQFELKTIFEWMINDYGPAVLRLGKHSGENYLDNNYQFIPGQPVSLRRGEQICLFSYGAMLNEALKAAVELEKRGLSTQVINLSSLHPLNESKLLELAQNFEMLVTVEDHSRHGGIGSKIGDILLKNNLSKKLIKIGLESTPESGKYEDILTKHGLSAKAIYENIRENWIKS
jgi:transketolase